MLQIEPHFDILVINGVIWENDSNWRIRGDWNPWESVESWRDGESGYAAWAATPCCAAGYLLFIFYPTVAQCKSNSGCKCTWLISMSRAHRIIYIEWIQIWLIIEIGIKIRINFSMFNIWLYIWLYDFRLYLGGHSYLDTAVRDFKDHDVFCTTLLQSIHNVTFALSFYHCRYSNPAFIVNLRDGWGSSAWSNLE